MLLSTLSAIPEWWKEYRGTSHRVHLPDAAVVRKIRNCRHRESVRRLQESVSVFRWLDFDEFQRGMRVHRNRIFGGTRRELQASCRSLEMPEDVEVSNDSYAEDCTRGIESRQRGKSQKLACASAAGASEEQRRRVRLHLRDSGWTATSGGHEEPA